MMDEPKESDCAEVALKPTNKAGLQRVAESVERRAGTKGNADQQSTHRTQIRDRVSQALGRVRQAAKERKKERFRIRPPSWRRSLSARRPRGGRKTESRWRRRPLEPPECPESSRD